jgi:hypothetical protein
VDLETLNEGLGFLFAFLRQAIRQLDQAEDGGRPGAFTALGSLWQFIALFNAPLAEGLNLPILRLQDALERLDHNLVLPIVRPIPRSGRAPSSHAHLALRGHAAGTVKRLLDIGLTRKEAYDAVAKHLKQLRVRAERGSGGITGTTVRNWCNEVSTDVGRHGTSAEIYDSMFARLEEQQRFEAMSEGEAKRYALGCLAAWVQAMFPELKKPT